VASHVVAALGGDDPVAEVVVVASTAPSTPVGSRMLVWEGSTEGSLSDLDLDRRVATLARNALRSRRPGTTALPVGTARVSIFVEPHHPPDELVIVGAGHIARPLCHVGALLGFRVIVLDDRPGFATRERFPEAQRLVKADFSDPFREVRLGSGTHLVLVTRGHRYDYDALRDVLRRDVELPYIGMVGSQRRIRAALDQLAKEGLSSERLSTVYAPIGLDIEAETPEEIAVSIAAELIRVKRGGTGVSMKDRARIVERWFKE